LPYLFEVDFSETVGSLFVLVPFGLNYRTLITATDLTNTDVYM